MSVKDSALHSTFHNGTPEDSAAGLCEQQRRDWAAGNRSSVEDWLARHPAVERDGDAVLDLIYNEVVLREEFGEPVNADEFALRFPEYVDDIDRMFEVHAAFESDSRDETHRVDRPVDDERDGDNRWIGDYEILDELGRGGMGIVYKAREARTNRIVALKVVLAGRFASSQELSRFEAEAESAARLDHPGIVPVYHVGQDGDLYYFSMAYVDGETLADAFRNGPLPPTAAARLMHEIATAVDYAHSRGVIHRDLKPQNILLAKRDSSDSSNGERQRPRITDFGLAKQSDTADTLTITGQVLGTPHYMAPEQARADADAAGPATDVYALGAILYEALTGRPPFESDSAVNILWMVVNEEASSPRGLNRSIGVDLETICLKCLEKDPQRRYQSAAALADDLDRYITGRPIAARRVSQWSRFLRWCRRRPLVAALAGTILVLLIALAVGSTIAAFRLAEKQTETEANLQRARDAEALSKQRLFDSYLIQARLGRLSGLPGQRRDTLAAIQKGAKIARELELPAESMLALRTEAAAALSLVDTRVAQRRSILAIPRSNFAYDSAGKRVAVPQPDARVAIFRHGSAKPTIQLAGADKPVNSLVWSSNGNALAGLCDGALLFWDLNADDGRAMRIADNVTAIDWTADGKRIIAIDRDGILKIWDPATKTVTARHRVGRAKGCKVAPHGREIAVWLSKEVRLVDLKSGKRVVRLTHDGGGKVQAVAWSPDGRLLAVGESDHFAYLWDRRDTSRPQFALKGHETWVKHVAFSPDGNLLLTAGRAVEQTFLWNPWTGRRLIQLDGSGCFFERDGAGLIGIEQNTVVNWELSRNTVVRSFRGSSMDYVTTHAAISNDGRYLATGNWDGTRLWDFKSGREIAFINRANEGVTFSPDSKTLVTSEGPGLFAWPVRDFREGGKLPRPKKLRSKAAIHCAKSIGFTRNGRTLFTLNPDEAVARFLTFDPPDQPPVVVARPHLDRGAAHPDGRWIAGTSSGGKGLTVWDDKGRIVKQLLPKASNLTCGFTPDGKLLVVGGNRKYGFWKPGTWEPSYSMQCHRDAKTSRWLSFARDSELMAISHDGKSLHVVRTDTGRVVWILPSLYYDSWVALTPDGRQLACADSRAGVRVWDLQELRKQIAELGLGQSASSTFD